MHFNLVDAVVEVGEGRIVTLKQVTRAEEYLGDHFPEFPVLPGVLMLEAMVQAARRLMAERPGPWGPAGSRRWVLGGVRAVKYGAFVKPGQSLRVEVTAGKPTGDGGVEFRGEGTRLDSSTNRGAPGGIEPATAVSGKFVLRPMRLEPPRAGPVEPEARVS